MSGASSRRKGHDFERKIAQDLRSIFGEQVGRGLQTQGGTAAVPDVDGTPFYVECKKGKRTNIKAALQQAADASDDRWPTAICRDDRTPATVTMFLDDWLQLVYQWHYAPKEDSNGSGE